MSIASSRKTIADDGATKKLISTVENNVAKHNYKMVQVALGCLLNFINDCGTF